MAVGTFKLPIVAGSSSTPSWTRPTDWLTMPTPGSQEVVGLMAVYDDGDATCQNQQEGAYKYY